MDRDLPCLKTECRMNDSSMDLNCTLVQIKNHVPEDLSTEFATVRQVGDLFDVSKQAINIRLKKSLKKLEKGLRKLGIDEDTIILP